MKSILALGLFMAAIYLHTCMAQGNSGDGDLMYDNVRIKVLKKSGKMIIIRELPGIPVVTSDGKGKGNDAGNKKPPKDKKPPKEGGKKEDGEKPDDGPEMRPPRRTAPIEISMAQLKPRMMGGPGRKKMTDFSKQEFIVTPPENTTIPDTNIKAVQLTVSTTLTALNDTALKVQIYIIKENGTFSIGDEEHEVVEGMFKFSIELSGGNWDDDIFVDFKLKSRRKAKKQNRRPGKRRGPKFNLGENSFITLSELVKVDDGDWQNQCTDSDNTTYPVIKEKMNQQIMRFCIPQFTSKALIDPMGDCGTVAAPQTEDSGANNMAWSLIVLLLSTLITTLGM